MVPAQQRGRSREEDRPTGAGEQPGQRREHDPVGGLQLRPVYLAAEHRDLVAQDEEFDVLGAVVAGELGQHLQHLAQEQVHQRHAHGRQLTASSPQTTREQNGSSRRESKRQGVVAVRSQ